MHKSKEHENVDKSLSFDNVNIYSDLKIPNKNIKDIIVNILLKDRTTNNNIIFATDSYSPQKDFKDEINIDDVKNRLFLPRYTKNKQEQKKRTSKKAEVFTPTWICNKMNNLVDEQWFGRPNVFNIEKDKSWITTTEKINFPDDKNFIDYITALRLEITCGEAPFITSRYDTVTGETILFKNRIGLLDRKLRVIIENLKDNTDILSCCLIAFKSIYGYEYQGDNLIIARFNLLQTFLDFAKHVHLSMDFNFLIGIAEIISWNIWQMNGLTDTTPNTNILCKIKDWQEEKIIKFSDLKKGE